MIENLKGKGVKFGSGQDATKGGRKKKLYNSLKSDLGYSADDIRDAFKDIALSDRQDIEKLMKDKDAPAILLVIARAFQVAVNKGDYRQIKEIMEHVLGRPVQTTNMDLTTKGEAISVDYSKLSIEELIQLRELEAKARIE
jgi:hypothetical protein